MAKRNLERIQSLNSQLAISIDSFFVKETTFQDPKSLLLSPFQTILKLQFDFARPFVSFLVCELMRLG
ncbi:hypothetical protein AAHA92_31616 [Salvia divinorum]|uniref:Uncharacterized protein n=1 Tax=Salvia divinorum TaxID=28513 RepID=A0ABD1FJ00_SALDI